MRILVVEDDPLLADGLQAGLKQAGFDADRAKDGVEASLALGLHAYAAVLLDLGLPRLGGLELLRKLRANGNTRAGAGSHGARGYRGSDPGIGQRGRRLRRQTDRPRAS